MGEFIESHMRALREAFAEIYGVGFVSNMRRSILNGEHLQPNSGLDFVADAFIAPGMTCTILPNGRAVPYDQNVHPISSFLFTARRGYTPGTSGNTQDPRNYLEPDIEELRLTTPIMQRMRTFELRSEDSMRLRARLFEICFQFVGECEIEFYEESNTVKIQTKIMVQGMMAAAQQHMAESGAAHYKLLWEELNSQDSDDTVDSERGYF